MNRLAIKTGLSSRASYSSYIKAQCRPPLLKLGITQINQQSLFSTCKPLYANHPAGDQERPELPSDKNRTAQSPKSSDEKIMDRAQEADKGKESFTEAEQERKGLDKKEGYGEGEAEEQDKSRGRNS